MRLALKGRVTSILGKGENVDYLSIFSYSQNISKGLFCGRYNKGLFG